MVGTHQRLAKVEKFCVKASDRTLSRVFKFKYLGVVLDPTLSWNDHIGHISSKISSCLGMLRKARKVIPREACVILYTIPWYFHFSTTVLQFATVVVRPTVTT